MHTETSLMPPDLRYLPNFLTSDEEQALIKALAPFDWDGRGLIKRYGQIVRRRELDFLHDYGRNNRRVSTGTPLPEFLAPLRARVATAVQIAPEAIGQIITALYRPGAGIDWHTDSIKAFGEPICSVSLGAPCIMQFRRSKAEGVSYRIALAPRSLLIMEGAARWGYQHHISAVKEQRYSVTLRTLKDAHDPT
jgi:alkylated DNA repair dioxygenase AlkB